MPDMLPPAVLDLWTSPRGQQLLEQARATRGLDPLKRPATLAGSASPEEARALLLQDDLRARAAAKTAFSERLLFTRSALEQASAWPVAEDRARRFGLAAGSTLADLGAGIGLDALAAAQQGLEVIACERDPGRARLLAFNVRALGLEGRVEVRTTDAVAEPPEADAAFLDPDRRAHGRRTRNAAEFEPPLAAWEGLLGRYARAIVKLSPSDDRSAGARPVEVVSLGGEARERRLLWRGFEDAPPRRALALPGGTSVVGHGLDWPAPRAPAAGQWLLDPDVSVTLAGLVGELCAAHGLAPIHPRIAYLLGTGPDPRAPGTWLRIEAVLPPDVATLNTWLAARDVGQLEIRSRGVADDATRWRRRLTARGRGAATLLFTRSPDDRWVALAAQRSAGSA